MAVKATNQPETPVATAIQSVRHAVAEINNTQRELATRIGAVRDRITEIENALPSRQEVIDYSMASLNQTAEDWRESVRRQLAFNVNASTMIEFERTRWTSASGKEVRQTTKPQSINFLAIDNVDPKAWPNQVIPMLAGSLYGVLQRVIATELEVWLKAADLPFPDVPVMPLAERPAELARLRDELTELERQMKDAELAMASLSFTPAKHESIHAGAKVTASEASRSAEEILNEGLEAKRRAGESKF